MIRYKSNDVALVRCSTLAPLAPWIIMALAAITVIAFVRWAYAIYVQHPLLEQYGALIVDIFGRIPGIDNLLVVDHPDRWLVVTLVVGTVFCVVVIMGTTWRARERRRFYDATDANPVERQHVDRLTAGFPTLMREHGIGVHTTVDRVFGDGVRTHITPPILRRIMMEPSGPRIAVRPADGQSASQLVDQWEKSASIFQEIDFDTTVERNVVYIQLYTRTGGASDVTLSDLNGGDE